MGYPMSTSARRRSTTALAMMTWPGMAGQQCRRNAPGNPGAFSVATLSIARIWNYADKLEFLKQATGLTLLDVVMESVDQNYARVRSEADSHLAELDRLFGYSMVAKNPPWICPRSTSAISGPTRKSSPTVHDQHRYRLLGGAAVSARRGFRARRLRLRPRDKDISSRPCTS